MSSVINIISEPDVTILQRGRGCNSSTSVSSGGTVINIDSPAPFGNMVFDSVTGVLTSYSENGIKYTISYNTNGSVNTIIGGGITQTFQYDTSGNFTGVTLQ